jgi:RNA recognition motif-containing protein
VFQKPPYLFPVYLYPPLGFSLQNTQEKKETMSATSASSLVLPSLNHPNTIKSFYSKPTSLSFLSLSSTSSIKPASLFLSFQQKQQQPLSSRFLKSVAISSEFGQEEDVFGDGDEPSFSPDLQLFVGNLPFNVNSAQLADLFKSAGNVEMVEVFSPSSFSFKDPPFISLLALLLFYGFNSYVFSLNCNIYLKLIIVF